MNEELKERLCGQGKKVFEATRRFENAKAEMDKAYASARVVARETRVAMGEKALNEKDTDAVTEVDDAYCATVLRCADAKAELERMREQVQNVE